MNYLTEVSKQIELYKPKRYFTSKKVLDYVNNWNLLINPEYRK